LLNNIEAAPVIIAPRRVGRNYNSWLLDLFLAQQQPMVTINSRVEPVVVNTRFGLYRSLTDH
jgi:hypothetical protein